MNRTHRVLWSDSLQAFVVTSEHSKTRGKPGSTRKALATAVALGLGSLLGSQAFAAGSCANGGASVIRQPVTITCTLASGGTLNVNTTGAITVASGPAVLLGQAATTVINGSVNDALLVRNAGQLSGDDGILLDHTALSGLISNAASGVIHSDAGAGVLVSQSALDGRIINAGVIRTESGTGIQVLDSAVAGDLDNRNAISSTVGIGVLGSSIGGSILDRGNINSDGYAIDVEQSSIAGSLGVQGSAAGGQGAIRLSQDALGGTLTNSGSLWSQQTAVALDRTLVQGNIGNSGTIAGSTGLAVEQGGFRSFANSGSITGNDFAVQISQAQVTGGISNSGLLAIVAPNWAGAPNPNIGTGLDIELSSVAKDIVNSGTISGGSQGGAGVKIGGSGLAGNIFNSGTISGQDLGLHLFSSSLKGSIVNDGVITANTAFSGTTGTALRLTGDVVGGSVVNNGLLGGWNTGLQLDRNLIKGDVINTGTVFGNLNAGVLLTYTDVDGDLHNSGSVIGGLQDGIRLENSSLSGGSLINDGFVTGWRGIVLQNANVAKDLVNTARVQVSTAAIELDGSRVGGALINSGSLSGHSLGVLYINDHSSVGNGITNSGSISNTAGGAAIVLQDSQVLAGGIVNSGSASGSGGGLLVQGSTVIGGIANAGTIDGGDASVNGNDGLRLNASTLIGDLSNVGGGTISGQFGVNLQDSTVVGNIFNSATLAGSQYGLALSDGLVTGSIENTGVVTGLSLTDTKVQGALQNDGTISSSQLAGIYAGPGSVLYSGLFNSGTITQAVPQAGGAGVLLDHAQIVSSAGIVNYAGSISGANGGVILNDSSVLGGIFNLGTLAATSTAAGASGLGLSNSVVTGILTNNGLITGSNGADPQGLTAGVSLDHSTLGGLNNLDDGTISGRTAIAIGNSTLAGDLYNAGTITSPTLGVHLYSSSLLGSIVNYGQITANPDLVGQTGTGMLLSASVINGSISNIGSIFGWNTGLEVDNSQVTGSLINSGSLFGDFNAGLAVTNSTIAGDLQNSGQINGGLMDMIRLQGSTLGGSLINAGYLTGAGRGLALLDSSVGQDVVNSGSMALGTYGIQIDHSQVGGTVSNSGSISGHSTAIIYVSDGSTIGNGIVNSGSLVNSSGGAAIVVQDSQILAGGIHNSGNALGVRGGLLVNGSTLAGGISNSGLISGDYNGAGGTGGNMSVGTGAIELNNSTLSGGFSNSGTVQSADALVSGNNGLSVSESVINGTLVNSGSITGHDGISLDHSTVNGDLVNSGLLSGYIAPINLNASVINGSLVNSGNTFGLTSFWLQGSTISGSVQNSASMSGGFQGLVVRDTVIGGDLVNSGAIGAHLDENEISNSSLHAIVNSGSLYGYDNGLSIQGSQVSGGIVNSGTISGSGVGVNIGNSTVASFVNSGTLSGFNYALLADASLQQLTITGANTAVFSGAVQAPETHVSIAEGAAYTMNAGNLFTVADFTNYGTLTLASNATGTIAGNYIQDANGTLSTQAVNATTFGKLNVTGTATLPDQAKFNVDVVDSGQSFNGATLNNVLSAGTLNSNGTYAVTSNSALYNFSGVKDGNSVDLVASPKSTSAVTQALQSSGASTNLSAARVLDSAIASNSSLTPFFVGATSGAGVASAVSQTLPSNAVAASQVSQSTLSTITDVIQSRIDANTGLASGDGFYGDKNLWMKPFGSWINQSQHGNTPGYDASVYGMAFGVDAPVNELTRLGVSFSYANADTNSKADVAAQSAKVDLYQLMGYGSYTLAPDTELSFHAGVGQNRNDGERNISLNGIGGKAKADYDSRSFTAGVALAKAFDLNPTTRFIPSVRADYTWMKDDSYHEKGNAALQPLLLDVDKHQTDQLILGVDGKLSHEIVPGTQVTGNLGVGYDVIHDDSMLTSAYAGAPGQTFNTVGQSSSPWLARGGVGLTTKIAANGTELSVNYDAEARTDFTNQTVSLKLKMPF